LLPLSMYGKRRLSDCAPLLPGCRKNSAGGGKGSASSLRRRGANSGFSAAGSTSRLRSGHRRTEPSPMDRWKAPGGTTPSCRICGASSTPVSILPSAISATARLLRPAARRGRRPSSAILPTCSPARSLSSIRPGTPRPNGRQITCSRCLQSRRGCGLS